jgi:hypothetical protein
MAPKFRVCAVLLALQSVSALPAQVGAQDVISPWKDTATGFGPDVGLAKTWNASFPLVEGIASSMTTNGGAAGSDVVGLNRRAAKDFWLRVMPLGASITQGIHSSDDNGYRKWIREQLRWEGWQVNSEGFMAPTDVNVKLLTLAGYSGGIRTDWDNERQGNP